MSGSVSIALAFWTVVSPVHQSPPRAREVLEKSMQKTSDVNIIATILQKDPFRDNEQKIQIFRDRSGRTRQCIISPLRMQGVQWVDDGERSLSVFPDQHLFIEQPVTQLESNDPHARMALARHNYRFTIDGTVQIAGREAYRIVATPRNPEIDVRRFYVDRATFYPLKLETTDPKSKTTIRFTVLDIQYPATLAADIFTLPIPADAKKETYNAPKLVTTGLEVKRILGFNPILPPELPFGFKIREMQIGDNPNWKPLSIRISDGLIRATVYQFIPDTSTKRGPMPNASVRNVGGLRLLLVSEVSPAIREKILDAFVAVAASGEMASRGTFAIVEPSPCLWAFSKEERCGNVVSADNATGSRSGQ